MNEYDLIYEELCERVECGELSLEDAEIINDVAYDKYVMEDMSDITLKHANRLSNLSDNPQTDPCGNMLRRPHRKNFNSNSEFKDALNNYDHGPLTKSNRGNDYASVMNVNSYRNSNSSNRAEASTSMLSYKNNIANRARRIKRG